MKTEYHIYTFAHDENADPNRYEPHCIERVEYTTEGAELSREEITVVEFDAVRDNFHHLKGWNTYCEVRRNLVEFCQHFAEND